MSTVATFHVTGQYYASNYNYNQEVICQCCAVVLLAGDALVLTVRYCSAAQNFSLNNVFDTVKETLFFHSAICIVREAT